MSNITNNKLNTLEREKFLQLGDRFEKQKESMRLLTQSRDNLERQIQTRTFELSKALEKSKRNEIALAEKEERLSLATKSNGVGIWDWNLQTQELLWDDSMFILHDIRRQDFSSTYDAWIASLHPDDHQRGNQETQDAISGKKPFDTEFRIVWPNGEIHHIKAVAEIFYDDNGKAVRMLGTNIDITEQKLAQQALVESGIKLSFERLQLQTLIKNIPDLVWLKDVDGVFLNCNLRVESLLGMKSEYIIGKTDYDFFDKAIADSFRINDLAAMQSNKARVNEEQVTFKDGHTELLETTKTAMFDPNGKIIGVLGLGHNITERKQDEQKLRKSEERWKFALEGAGDGIWEYNFQTGQNFVSLRLMKMLGFDSASESENLMSDWLERLHPDSQTETNKVFQAVIDNKTDSCVVEQQVRCEDGSYKWMLTRGMIVSRADDGKPQRMMGTVSDISSTKQEAQVKLQLAASVFSHAREGIMITNAAATIIDINDTVTQITGYSRQEFIGQNRSILQISDEQEPEFYMAMWQEINRTGYWTGELWNKRKDGEVYPANLTVSAVKDDIGKVSHYVALFSDITRQKNHQSQLEKMAHFDVLTNLPNRTLLADRLNQAILQSQRYNSSLAVLFLDLDGFKAVNDLHGHELGDELLIIVSLRMKEVLRDVDTLARIGGDEFVAVLADVASFDDCKPILERLLLAASAPIRVGHAILTVSASIGITLYPQDIGDADQLMRHADQAMYMAKQAGKNCYRLFDTAEDEAVNIQRRSLGDIHTALRQQQFILHYQPKVNMRSGEVIGAEALIRWQHPVRGLVPPLAFLPAIEGHAISLEIGEWVIDTALGQISQWQKMGLVLPISVNISAYQLQQADFIERLTMLLAAHPDVSPQHLELEVLETSALDDVQQVSSIMTSCMSLGVHFSLDDFGTGYSSLTYLRRLPVSLIKIDQSFVRDMLEDEDDLAIIEGVVALAKSFKREVIAEGVESIEHGTALLQLGCELAQGYGIAKPMPSADIPPWTKEWEPDWAWKV